MKMTRIYENITDVSDWQKDITKIIGVLKTKTETRKQ